MEAVQTFDFNGCSLVNCLSTVQRKGNFREKSDLNNSDRRDGCRIVSLAYGWPWRKQWHTNQVFHLNGSLARLLTFGAR